MLVFPKGYHQANIQPPKLKPEEEEKRQILLLSIREFDRSKGLKTGIITDDRSHPFLHKSVHDRPQKPMAPRGGGKALGDLFAGGFLPTQAALGGRKHK